MRTTGCRRRLRKSDGTESVTKTPMRGGDDLRGGKGRGWEARIQLNVKRTRLNPGTSPVERFTRRNRLRVPVILVGSKRLQDVRDDDNGAAAVRFPVHRKRNSYSEYKFQLNHRRKSAL